MSMAQTNLVPGLLLAMPQLMDPNFTRSVILMIEHGDTGSFGLVINQPSPIKATELLGSLDMPWCGDDDEVVWAGGPVSPTTGWVLHEPLDGMECTRGLGSSGTIEISPELCLSTSPEKLRQLAASPPPRMRLLLGYSGWAAGQLATEMARGSWLHADVDLDLIFDTPPDEMWSAAMASLGIASPESVVQGRGVH
jgi:putative transcriptional regulator